MKEALPNGWIKVSVLISPDHKHLQCLMDTSREPGAGDAPLPTFELIQRWKSAYDEHQSREWQPIETAPKDGTDILLIRFGEKPIIGNWFAPENRFWFYPIRDKQPTHWMPLPKSPI